MSIDSLRKELLTEVESLDEDQLSKLLSLIQSFKKQTHSQSYDPEMDTMVGLLSDDPDTASRVEEILAKQSNSQSGWTQKES